MGYVFRNFCCDTNKGSPRNTGKYWNIIQAIKYKAIKDYNVAGSDGFYYSIEIRLAEIGQLLFQYFVLSLRPHIIRPCIKIQREPPLFLFLLLHRQQINQAPVFYRDLLLF